LLTELIRHFVVFTLLVIWSIREGGGEDGALKDGISGKKGSRNPQLEHQDLHLSDDLHK
jgi:hypothetical protein